MNGFPLLERARPHSFEMRTQSKVLCSEAGCRASASVLMAALAGVTTLTAVGLGLWISVAGAVNRAGTAADLAALAAADAARALTPGSPCELAGQLARRNGAQLTGCTIEPSGVIVRVTVQVALPSPLAALGSVRGRARAGPPPASSGS